MICAGTRVAPHACRRTVIGRIVTIPTIRSSRTRPIFRRDSAVAEPVASGPDDASTPLPAAAPAAVAVDAPASASSPERPPVTFVRVKKDSDPSKIASFICLQLEQRPDDQIMLTAAGNLACLVAVKALAYARNRLLMTRRVSLQFQPQTQLKRGMQQAAEAAPEDAAQQQQQQQGEQSQEQQQQQRPSTQSVLATVNMWASVTPVDPSADAAAAQAPPTVVRVGRNTDARALATALAGLVRKEGPLRVAAVGSGATKNALRALSLARWELVVDAGKDLVVTAEVQRGVRQNAAEASAAAPAPAAAEGAAAAAQEGEGQAGAGGDEIRTLIVFNVGLTDPRPGLVDTLKKRALAAARRGGGRGGRGVDARAGGRGRGGRSGPNDGQTVTVPKAEWDGVKEQLDMMAQQTEQLLNLLSQQAEQEQLQQPQQESKGE